MNYQIYKLVISASMVLTIQSALAQSTKAPATGEQIHVAPHIDTSVEGMPLNYLVNTSYKEFGPMPTKDGTRLYFSRQGHPENTGGSNDEDIWYSEFDEVNQSWTKAINMGPPLNTVGPNFITGVGIKGDTLLLGNIYGKHGKMSAGLSISLRVGNQWSFPQPVKVSDDYNLSSKTGYDLSHDRNALIIAQEKVDSKGGLDLYVSFRDPDAKYPFSGKESVNLGPVINTFGDETSPWLSYDGRTLFFSSNGHNGYGSLDIFMSKRLDNTWTNWSEPLNLGPGINSVYDDMSFNYNPKDRFAYFSRGLSPTNTDIFQVEMTRLFKSINDPITELGENTAEIGQVQVVDAVFNANEYEIKKEALSALEYFSEFMKKYKGIHVLISAHSNIHESRMESTSLSNERASAVMNYLISKGVDKNRLNYRGLGHDVVANTKDKTLQNTLTSSVEFKLIRFDN